jgi:hypothetical protein
MGAWSWELGVIVWYGMEEMMRVECLVVGFIFIKPRQIAD